MGQGSLTPPGAPGETMKSLEQVEPRTPIPSLPYTISESGSYYVTGNLSSTTHGIVIETSGVTVDLMGFSLTGDGTSSYPDYDYGIYVDGSTNAVIKNLVIKGGRIGGFFEGLYCRYMNNSRIEQMVVSGNTDKGVFLNGYSGQCDGNTISDSTISENGGHGVFLHGSNSGQCNGNTITDCTISGNGDDAVTLYGSGGLCNGNTVANCTIGNNTGRGIDLVGTQGQCDGNTLQGNSIKGNVDRGIAIFWGDGNRVEANTIWGTTGAVSYTHLTLPTSDLV